MAGQNDSASLRYLSNYSIHIPQVAWGEEKDNLFIATTPCKDDNAPASRGWGGYRRSFGRGSYRGFYSSHRRNYNSYGRGRYHSGIGGKDAALEGGHNQLKE